MKYLSRNAGVNGKVHARIVVLQSCIAELREDSALFASLPFCAQILAYVKNVQLL